MSAEKKGLKKIVMPIVRERLEKLGMRKRRGDYYTLELNSEVIGIVDLSPSHYNRGRLLTINPIIGVRHQPLEKLLAELKEEKFHSYIPPTILIPIGYLMPSKSFITWKFMFDINYEVIVDDMINAIKKYGFAYMDDHKTLEAIFDSIIYGYRKDQPTWYLIPVGYYLLGDSKKAKKYINNKVNEIRDYPDMILKNYQKFASNLLKLIGEGISN
ncbi:MAG: hypothetical protein ACYTEQ_26305 [Planctomycetota bacterium]|jgi:hypothetical protein